VNLLLDTHIFLWYISKDKRLPALFRDAIRNFDNQVFLSVVSLWEAIVKYQLDKLPLPTPPETYLPVQRKKHQIESLDLDESSVSHLSTLPPIHRDPFDRMLICQALEHGLILVTVDKKIGLYPVQILSQDSAKT